MIKFQVWLTIIVHLDSNIFLIDLITIGDVHQHSFLLLCREADDSGIFIGDHILGLVVKLDLYHVVLLQVYANLCKQNLSYIKKKYGLNIEVTLFTIHKHCTYTALLEKANVQGAPLIERFLLRLLNSSSIRFC